MRPNKDFTKDGSNFRTLFENNVMLIGHIYENAYSYNKLTKEEFAIFTFDNDPTCALVGQNNDWCLIGGEVLVLKIWIDNTLRIIGDLKDIHELKATEAYTVQILTDPWTTQSAIWQLDIDLNKLTRPTKLFKVRDFKDYIYKPYIENIAW